MNQFTMPPITPVPFNGVMAFAWVGVFLIIGMLLRATFPVFRKYLIPACIIGGTIGLLFQSSGLLNMTGFALDTNLLQLIVYHLFNLTWVYFGLKMPLPTEKGSGSTTKNVVWIVGISLLCAGLAIGVGMTATTLTNSLGLSSGPNSLGALTGIGFFNGPGQTLTIAKIWESATPFTGLSDFALAVSTMGYAVSIVVGILLMNIIARKKKIDILSNPSPSEECGYYDECDEVDEAGKITTSPSNIDVFAWHIALGLGCYFLALVLATVLLFVLPAPLKPFVWTTFYLLGTCIGVAARVFLVKIGKRRLLCNGVISRVSNTLVDFLVCATFISIQVGNIAQYVWPYFVSCIFVGLATAGGCWFYCRKLKYEGPETFAFMFGTNTGTISTGLILLRMIDPQSKSQVPIHLAVASVFMTPAYILLMAIVHMENLYNISIFLSIGASFILAIVGALVMYFAKLPQTKKAWQDD